MAFELILILFSGACALIYQALWMRALLPILGLSVYAATVVISSFMSGIGLGSILAPLLLRGANSRRSWRLLGCVELGIALFALSTPSLLRASTSIYSSLDYTTSGSLGIRIALGFGLLVVPTTLMGLTLPIFLRAYRSRAPERSIGYVYAINTMGGVLGCLLAGLLLIEFWGVQRSIQSTALGQVLLALGCFFVGRRDSSGAVAIQHTAGRALGGHRALLLVCVGITGFVSLGVEIVWFRLLIFHVQTATYSFTLLLAVFLLGLGLGSLAYASLLSPQLEARPPSATVLAASICQILIASFILLSLWLPSNLTAVWEILITTLGAQTWPLLMLEKALVSAVLMLPGTFLMGCSFPLIARLYQHSSAQTDDAVAVSLLYAANTLGAVLGTCLTTFVLFEWVGIQGSVYVFCALSCLAAALLAWNQKECRAVIISFALITALVPRLVLPSDIMQRNYQKIFRYHDEFLLYRESASDIAFVIENRGNRKLVFHDGRGTSGTGLIVNQMNRLLAYSAMALRPEAKDVLVISMGCGNTASAFCAFPIERLDIVDISPAAFDAAPFFWTNRNVIQDPRVRTHVEDGRNYLLRTNRKYDIIQIELPRIHSEGVVFLYTREFYELAKRRLKNEGIISQWLFAGQTQAELSKLLLRTMSEAFPNTICWSVYGIWWFTGGKEDAPLKVDLQKTEPLFETESVLADVASVKLEFQDVLSCLTGSGQQLRDAVGNGRVASDDLTIVDFEVQRLKCVTAYGGALAKPGTRMWELLLEEWSGRIGVDLLVFAPRLYSQEAYPEELLRSMKESILGLDEELGQDLVKRHLERQSLWDRVITKMVKSRTPLRGQLRP